MSVYKITDGEKVYYGSTIQPLHRRLTKHKCPSNGCETRQLNSENMTIELLEEVEDKEQRLLRERYYVENNECVNKHKPKRTEYEIRNPNKEYYEKNKTRIQEYQKNYNKLDKNKEHIKQMKSRPYQCECGSVISSSHKAKHFKSKKHIKFINFIDE